MTTGLYQTMTGDRVTYLPDTAISKTEHFQRGTYCYKCLFFLSILMMISGCVVICYLRYQDMETDKVEYMWFLTFLLPLNIVIEQVIGRYIICLFFYPYQNSLTREQIDRSNNLKFGQEFSHFLDSFLYTLQNKKRNDNTLKDSESENIKS